LREILEEARAGTLIFSCLRDKPAAEMAQILFPLFARVIFAPIASPRATPVSDLLVAAEATGTPAEAAGSVSEALQSARNGASGGVVVISGSVYLVGAARTLLLAGLKQPVGAGA
jgi:dihydrofolate synthase/folylpolyglutamate synthase